MEEKKWAFVNSDKGVLIIFNEEANVDEAVVKTVSKEICAPVMFLYIYDSDGWGYFLSFNHRLPNCNLWFIFF